MASFRPEITDPIPLVLLVPTKDTKLGVTQKTYPTIEEALQVTKDGLAQYNLFFGTFKTYGGTERAINGVYSIEDTATINTWYRPDIKSDCRIALDTGEIYDIINEPEDINKRHQFLKFKVKRVKGKV